MERIKREKRRARAQVKGGERQCAKASGARGESLWKANALRAETFAHCLIVRGWVSPEREEVVVKGRDKGPKSRMVSVQEVASSQEEA